MPTNLSATIERLRELIEKKQTAEDVWRNSTSQEQRKATFVAYCDACDRLSDAAIEALPALLRALEAREEPVALNVRHPDGHKAADAFWKYWQENGETHKHGYYESTWGAINAALRMVGVVNATPPDTVRVPVGPTEEVISLERECGQLNDMCIAQRKLIEELASMCRRLSYAVKKDGRDALAAQCVQLLKKHGLGGSVLRVDAAAPKEGKS